MKLDAAPRIMIVAGACALALIGVVALEGAARASGQEVLLEVRGVDPPSILSGHYVQLRVSQTLKPSDYCPDDQPGWDWIALRPIGGGVYGVAGGAHSRDQTEQIGPLPVKGSFTCVPPAPASETDPAGVDGAIDIEIGVDRFYINQNEAQRISALLNQQRAGEAHVYAIVSVGRDGRARLKGLQMDGKRLELSWL